MTRAGLAASFLVLAFASALPMAARADAAEQRWALDARDHGDQVQLNLRRAWSHGGDHVSWSSTTDVARADIHGLDRARGNGPVSLTLDRDAGIVHLDGRFENGRGSGTFTFEPNREFIAALERAGFRDVTNEDLLRLCVDDLGLDWIRDARALGLRDASLDDLLRIHDRGIDPGFVRGLRDAGYERLTADDIARLHDHAVTLEYVRGIDAPPGRRPGVEDLVKFKDHGIEPGYVSALAPHYEPEEIVRLHDNGVGADYVRDFRALGYKSITAEELTRLHNNGVSPAFARRARELHGDVSVEDLIKLKTHGLE